MRAKPRKDFVLCLCSGGLPDSVATSVERVVNVLTLADKYEVTALTDACVWVLSTAVSASNVVQMVALAERNGLAKLMRALMNFIKYDAKLADIVMNSAKKRILEVKEALADAKKELGMGGGKAAGKGVRKRMRVN
jgi:uncharacterized membrane protein